MQLTAVSVRSLALLFHVPSVAHAQGGHPQPAPPPTGAKSAKCAGRPVPQLEDITSKTGITLKHTSDPAKKYIVVHERRRNSFSLRRILNAGARAGR